MSKRYQALLQERADLVKEQKDLFVLVEKEARGFTDQEKTRDDAIHARLTDIAGDVAREERRREWERTVEPVKSPAASITEIHNRIEDDPKRGFANLGDFALAVRAAYSPGGKMDERLTIGAAPTNFLQETGADEGRMVPPAFKQDIFEAITASDDVLLKDIDCEPTNSNVVELIRDESTPWGATGVQAYWRSEGVQLTQSKLVTDGEQVRLNELYAFVLATEELLADAPRLNDRLTRKSALAITYKLNDAIVNGTGAGQPKGWFSGSAKVTFTRTTASRVKAEDVSALYGKVLGVQQANWYINPDVFSQLPQMVIGQMPVWTPPSGYMGAPGGLLLGRPVKFLENCKSLGTSGDIQLVNPKGYYGIMKGLDPAYAESMHLFFDYNIRAFRWIFRFGGQPYLSAPITPANGSNQRAHVAVLV